MRTDITTRQLVQKYQEEQQSLFNQQNEWLHLSSIGDLSHTKFYLKTLSGLVMCGELVVSNAQIRELNRNKITMLRKKISEVSARIETFKGLLSGFYKPFNGK